MRKSKQQDRPSGITLVEILVVALLLSFVIGALVSSLTSSHITALVTDELLYAQQETRRAIDTVLKEVREAGPFRQVGVTGDASFANQPGVDFQISRGLGCAGVCWGDETATGRWLHYVLNQTNPNNPQLMRCSTATQTAGIDFSTCRVVANHVLSFGVDFDAVRRTVKIRLQIQRSHPWLPGGRVTADPHGAFGQTKLRIPFSG